MRESKQQRIVCGNLHDSHLEGIKCVTILSVQGPSNGFVQVLESNIMLFGNMTQDRMNSFALIVLFFALGYFFGGNTTLGQIDIA